MARARLLKPGFFQNEELAELPAFARLLFAGLWTIADREGRMDDRPKRIKAEIFPYDKVNVPELLDKLETKGFIQRYQIENAHFIEIVNFGKHQQPHYMEPLSVIPGPDGEVASSYVAQPVGQVQRRRIFERDGKKCVRCGSVDRLSIDHVIPRSAGGDSEDSNLQTLCKSCNSKKRNRVQADAVLNSTRSQPPVSSSSDNTSTPEAEAVTETVTEAEAEAVSAPAGVIPGVGDELGDHAFTVEFSRRYAAAHGGAPPSPNTHGAARSLERDFGTERCMAIAADYEWNKHPNWLREALNDPNRGKRTQATGGVAANASDRAEQILSGQR